MRIIRDYLHTPSEARGAAVAIGNFEGLHLGHRAVIAGMREQAEKLGVPAAVMTFEPHPRQFFSPRSPSPRLFRFSEKIAGLRALGVEYLFVMRFNRAFSQITAQEFTQDILRRHLGVAHVVTGRDFIFGHKRQGNADFLRSEADRLGFGFTAVSPVLGGDDVCSSTRIRKALDMGNVTHAAEMLGRPYTVTGRVIHGDKRGRTLGFPTANLSLRGLHLPRFGIYAGRVQASSLSSAYYPAAISVGIRPMFMAEAPLLEAHLLDFKGDLYGSRLRVELSAFLREERRFDDVAALTAQMERDCAQARDVLTRA